MSWETIFVTVQIDSLNNTMQINYEMFYFLIDSMPASLDNKIQNDSCTNWDSRVFKVCFFFVLLFERDKTLH